MTYGKGLVESSELKQHQAMAQGKKDSGGMAGSMGSGVTTQKMGGQGEMPDSQRGCEPCTDRGRDHYRREGKL